MTFLLVLTVIGFLDIYWYLQYNHDEPYRYGCGLVMRFTVGKGIKKKEITRGDGVQYLIRYTIHTNKLFSIKLHKIYASDDACLHDHPWAFISIVLRNGYIEQTFAREAYNYCGDISTGIIERELADVKSKRITAPAILFRNAQHAHRLIIDKPATTLVITFKKVRAWGFYTRSGWKFWRTYHNNDLNHCE